jgi:DNA repair photolyase
MAGERRVLKARGAAANPPNRFQPIRIDLEPGADPEEEGGGPDPRTVYLRDASRSALATNDSPDIGFEASLNPYRGCEVGCAYCYARPYHEYLGFSAGLDFETKILVKEDAPELLRKELSARSWRPQVVAMSGVTDCYQPIEQRLRITRRCLEVFAEFRNPVGVITKRALVTRDADVLADLARHDAAVVHVSITSLDRDLQRRLEPRASPPELRLAAIRALTDAGVPTCVLAAPAIPGLNDHELPAILAEAAKAGAVGAGYTVLRLPHAVKDVFSDWLERNLPDRKEKVLNRVRSMRGGRLNEPRFGHRMSGEGLFADQIRDLFAAGCRRAGIPDRGPQLSTASFRRPGPRQQTLFD